MGYNMDKVVVVGSANYDIFLSIPSMIQIGETLTASNVSKRIGGKGANQAIQLAKLGVETSFIGCIGSDEQGKAIEKRLSNYGVDIRALRTTPTHTGMGIVHSLMDGSVFATIEKGANYSITRDDIDNAKEMIKECTYMILQMEIPNDVVSYAVTIAKEYGLKVVLNASPAKELSDYVRKNVDFLAVNEVEASYYLHSKIYDMESAIENLSKFRDEWNENITVICTLGKAGAVLYDGACIKIPAIGKKVVETTGAGDSFLGGFIYSLCMGKNLEESGKLAACCSAYTIGRIGAQEAMPDLNEVMEEYNKN